MVRHYAIYARGKGKPLINSRLADFVVFIIATSVISHFTRELAVPFGLIGAFGSIRGWETRQFYRLTPVDWR